MYKTLRFCFLIVLSLIFLSLFENPVHAKKKKPKQEETVQEQTYCLVTCPICKGETDCEGTCPYCKTEHFVLKFFSMDDENTDIYIKEAGEIKHLDLKSIIAIMESDQEEEDTIPEETEEEDIIPEEVEEVYEIKESDTLKYVNEFDYYSDSVTGLTKESYTRKEIEDRLKDYGTFDGPMGMPVKEYKEAMNAKWVDVTKYENQRKDPRTVELDLDKKYTYDDLVSFMEALSDREGVYMFDIGSTTLGRRMYALEIDIPSDYEKKVVVLTGNIHARETAGSVFIIKEIAELLQSDTDEAKKLLQKIKFAIVPCVNPDGREGVAFNTSKYKYSNGQLWKATSNGTDLNRNFPGLSWSQVKEGYEKSDFISDSSKKIYYPGDYAGSCNETKAMMKFLYHYIKIEKAQVLIDYHQQGRIGYAGKPFQKSSQQKRCKELAKYLFGRMNPSLKKYIWWGEKEEYGLNGTGSTLTDFAVSIATGAKFSPGYGFFVYTDGKKEYPLIMIPRLDDTSLSVVHETNSKFATTTIEIGYGKEYLGYGSTSRELLKKEYDRYKFGRLLYYLYDYLY